MKGDIHCTVAVLTRNSGETLERALLSVKDFSDILVSDGGSTDNTLEIAAKFGALVIRQDPRFLSAEGRITDYAEIRNQTLREAKEEWFFFLDSDEYISAELADEIRRISLSEPAGVYTLFRKYTLPDGRVVHCSTTYPNPSTRFFARSAVTGFRKRIHEVIVPRESVTPIRMRGDLYVPLEGDIAFWRTKRDRYIELEVKRLTGGTRSFWPLFFKVVVRHSAISAHYILRHIRILLFCRGVKMPFPHEIERHRYHIRLVQALWRARKTCGQVQS